jgi:hypothetical protein
MRAKKQGKDAKPRPPNNLYRLQAEMPTPISASRKRQKKPFVHDNIGKRQPGAYGSRLSQPVKKARQWRVFLV